MTGLCDHCDISLVASRGRLNGRPVLGDDDHDLRTLRDSGCRRAGLVSRLLASSRLYFPPPAAIAALIAGSSTWPNLFLFVFTDSDRAAAAAEPWRTSATPTAAATTTIIQRESRNAGALALLPRRCKKCVQVRYHRLV